MQNEQAPKVGGVYRIGARSKYWWILDSVDEEGFAYLHSWESDTVHRECRASSLVAVA